jgi:hypothetical protein
VHPGSAIEHSTGVRVVVPPVPKLRQNLGALRRRPIVKAHQKWGIAVPQVDCQPQQPSSTRVSTVQIPSNCITSASDFHQNTRRITPNIPSATRTGPPWAFSGLSFASHRPPAGSLTYPCRRDYLSTLTDAQPVPWASFGKRLRQEEARVV